MRTFITSLLVLLLSAGFVLAQEAEIRQNETDEFTGERIVQTEFVSADLQEGGSELLYQHSTSVFYNEGTWFLVLSTTSDSWALLDTDKAYFLADGERFERQLLSQENEVQDSGSVYELNVVRMNEELRSAFENAEQVRMKTGSYVFDISGGVDDEIQTIKEIL